MYSGKQKGIHPYRLFNKALKEGEIPSLIMLCGPEDYLSDWAVSALKEKYINPASAPLDFTLFSGDEIDESDIISAAETLPLLSEKKLVVVKHDPEEFPAIAEYLKTVPETTILCFVWKNPDKRKAVFKRIQKNGIVYDFQSLDEPTLAVWALKRLKAMGKEAGSEDLIRFASECGYFDKERSYGLYNLDNDLKKAAALSENTRLNFDDMFSVSSAENDSNAFKLLDCAFSGKKGEALKLLNSSINCEIPSKQLGVILRFQGLLISQLEIMLEARERKEEGQNMEEIKSEMEINPFRLKKAVEASAKLSTPRLRSALAALYSIERDIKGGKMLPRLAMELFIAQL